MSRMSAVGGGGIGEGEAAESGVDCAIFPLIVEINFLRNFLRKQALASGEELLYELLQ